MDCLELRELMRAGMTFGRDELAHVQWLGIAELIRREPRGLF